MLGTSWYSLLCSLMAWWQQKWYAKVECGGFFLATFSPNKADLLSSLLTDCSTCQFCHNIVQLIYVLNVLFDDIEDSRDGITFTNILVLEVPKNVCFWNKYQPWLMLLDEWGNKDAWGNMHWGLSKLLSCYQWWYIDQNGILASTYARVMYQFNTTFSIKC